MRKKLLAGVLAALLAVGTLTGCGETTKENKDTKSAKKERVEKVSGDSDQILFNGSTSLAPVITAIATNFNEEYGTWKAYESSLPDRNIAIYVSAGGSGQGTKAVIDGTSNFGMVAREVKEKEKAAINDEKEYKVGIDALTLAVNPENPVCQMTDDLSKEDIIKLFSGEYKTWKDFDASLPEEEIIVITRDINGGAHEVFQKKIMGDTPVKSEAIQASSMGELVKNIIDNRWAIGYASYGVANQNEGKVIKFKVDGVEANAANIKDGSYIIQRPLLLVASGEPSNIEKAFLDVILGNEGQDTVSKMGFIPVN